MNQITDPILSQRETINPYLGAARMIGDRLLWDLNPRSWASRKALRKIKNRNLGEKAVILCNGPSLLKVDFSRLEGTFCFGLNKLNLLFDRTAFRPSCIVAVNPYVIQQNQAFFNETRIPLFLDRCGLRNGIRPHSNMVFLHSTGIPKFARDCSISIFQGHTVTYVALQLAYHMGFQNIALVGCDHNYTATGPANATVAATGSETGHFDPDYFAAGMEWQLPDLTRSEIAYRIARDVFEAGGRKVVNATAGGQLEVFERQELETFLSE